MTWEGTSGYDILVINNKKDMYEIMNTILKNVGLQIRLSMNDTEDKVNEILTLLNNKEGLKIKDFINWEECTDAEAIKCKEEMSVDFQKVQFLKYDKLSEDKFLLALNLRWPDSYLKPFVDNISFDTLIIDWIEYEARHGGWYYSECSYYTRIFTNSNGNDWQENSDPRLLVKKDFFPIHYGLKTYNNILRMLDWANFYLENGGETTDFEDLKQQKKEIEEKLNSYLTSLSEITGFENNDQLLDNLKKYEFIPSLKQLKEK